jgi:hypothetical protein
MDRDANDLEGAAKDLLDKLGHLQAELDRLLGGLEATGASLAGALDHFSRDVGTLTVGSDDTPRT